MILNENRDELLGEVMHRISSESDSIVDDFLEENLLSIEDHQEISAEKKKSKAAILLLNLIAKRLPGSYLKLLSILKKHKINNLAERLLKEIDRTGLEKTENEEELKVEFVGGDVHFSMIAPQMEIQKIKMIISGVDGNERVLEKVIKEIPNSEELFAQGTHFTFDKTSLGSIIIVLQTESPYAIAKLKQFIEKEDPPSDILKSADGPIPEITHRSLLERCYSFLLEELEPQCLLKEQEVADIFGSVIEMFYQPGLRTMKAEAFLKYLKDQSDEKIGVVLEKLKEKNKHIYDQLVPDTSKYRDIDIEQVKGNILDNLPELLDIVVLNTEEKKQKLLEELKERIGKKTGAPLTVAVIGTPGSGKSSFINTMITSITGNYRKWRRTADFGGLPVTQSGNRISREKYLYSADKSLREYDFPDFVEIAGFQNTNDEMTYELLDLLFYGRIPSNVHLANVAGEIRRHGKWFTDKMYPETPECKKFDRVIFVASAADRNLPVQLMQAVSRVLYKKRDIPVFGVFTKKDLEVQERESEDFEKLFRTTLGLSQLDYLHCTNYCDDNIKEIRERNMTHYPELDIPVLKFLIQVLDPIAECTDLQRNIGISKKSLEWKEICNTLDSFLMIILTTLIAIILALILYF
ncbi:uncharacterized protein LOC134271809 [Saccostrea cucullata]|uniref:uncharacterized protein LOC134271809 n=1 Tax=Saccostrea cuccullata TaxID=36930 RepID=UPI002ED5C7D2